VGIVIRIEEYKFIQEIIQHLSETPMREMAEQVTTRAVPAGLEGGNNGYSPVHWISVLKNPSSGQDIKLYIPSFYRIVL